MKENKRKLNKNQIWKITFFLLICCLMISNFHFYKKAENQNKSIRQSEESTVETPATEITKENNAPADDVVCEEMADWESFADDSWNYVLKEYGPGPCNNYKTTIYMSIFDELKEYFPNLQTENWEITGQEDDHYIAQFFGAKDTDDLYTGEFLIYPDLTIEVLEDTIELHPENGFCTFTTGEIYLYHGCRMEECRGVYCDANRDARIDVSFPVFYAEGDEWDAVNASIWEGLEEWFCGTDYQQGTLMMDYEIKTLDNNFISLLFQGEFEKDGEQEEVKMGLTVSLSSEERLSCSVFQDDAAKDAFYDYYVEDYVLFSIAKEDEGWKETENGRIDWTDYSIHRMEKHVYNENGRWLGNCYYEVPVIVTVPEEYKTVSRHMREDAGKFLNQLADKFEEIVLFKSGDEPYASDYDYLSRDTEEDEAYAWYQCSVDTDITYNNGRILEITYHYTLSACGEIEEGEAVTRYDLNSGEVLEYQDWQSPVLEHMTLYMEMLKSKSDQAEENSQNTKLKWEWVIRPEKYTECILIGEELATVKKENGKYGIIGRNGEYAFSDEYDEVRNLFLVNMMI